MGNPFSSTSELQVHSVFTSFVKLGIYLQKNKKDRLVYSFLVKIEHYHECQMFLRDTCKRNKLNILNSTWKMVKVDCYPFCVDHSSCHDTKGWSTCDTATKPEGWPWIWPLQCHMDDCFDTWSKSWWSWNIQWDKQRKLQLIPHITIAPSDTELPLKCGQFPLQPCLAMSTNKAQGQTLQFVGIYLSDHVLTHSQLYIAFSRVTDPSALAVCLNNPDGFTRNVFQEVLWLSMYTLSRTMRSLCAPNIPWEARVGH